MSVPYGAADSSARDRHGPVGPRYPRDGGSPREIAHAGHPSPSADRGLVRDAVEDTAPRSSSWPGSIPAASGYPTAVATTFAGVAPPLGTLATDRRRQPISVSKPAWVKWWSVVATATRRRSSMISMLAQSVRLHCLSPCIS